MSRAAYNFRLTTKILDWQNVNLRLTLKSPLNSALRLESWPDLIVDGYRAKFKVHGVISEKLRGPR